MIFHETNSRVAVLNQPMKILPAILMLALAGAGCVNSLDQRLKEQNEILARQNAALAQPQPVPTVRGVTVIGSVQNSFVPWVVGLTLAQAIATANYVGANDPTQIILTRQGESATLDAKSLLNGADIPLEMGDVIELR
jgi:hypothetical protein